MFLACLALIGGSSAIPFINYYDETPTVLRLMWRNQIASLYGVPFSVYFLYQVWDTIKWSSVLSWGMLGEALACSFIRTFASILYVWSSSFTIVSHAVYLANLSGVFLVCVSLVRGKSTHRFEIVGSVIVVAAVLVLINDSSSSKVGEDSGKGSIVIGDLLALATTPMWAAFFILNSYLVKRLPSMVCFQITTFIQMLMQIAVYFWYFGTGGFVSFDEKRGMFGWASNENIVWSLLVFGPVTCIFGSGGYYFTASYFPPHIIGTIFLLEPVLGQIFGILLSQDHYPQILTYIGGIGIFIGVGLTIRGDLLKSNESQTNIIPEEPVDSIHNHSLLS
ncbi:unnamed protein product [Moneuplotes crassus]|uniref:EamA domain-containing protein n=1 Tax=Euplotes crassus TaxID=5936 RepID=A0AAD2CVE5_EUPCR|nr:unnamed protein product [Moneuplotes crassus]